MRTAIVLTVAIGLYSLTTVPSGAETIPAGSESVLVTNISTGTVITNLVALGTNNPTTNVSVAPIKVTVPAYENLEVLRVLTLNPRDTSNPAWATNASSATTNLPGANNLVGYDWVTSLPGLTNGLLVRVEMEPIDTNKMLTSIAFNRLAYGPTPYELAQILGTNEDGIIGGPGATGATKTIDQWINEQLTPWAIAEDVTNQFAELDALGNRFSGIVDVILSNTAITNVSFDGTNFVTNVTANTETNGPGTLSFHNFRAWYAMHCVGARRQLLEVLLYWLENHHVSQWTKARDTFSGAFNGQNSDAANRVPTALESREHMAYRNALLNPNVTWRELLRLQHQSQSMTVYLDTNDSRGNGENVANENYAREILELFCMGVDNGYDQRDITALSAIWTGWDVQKVHTNQARMSNGAPWIGLYASETNAYRLTASTSSNLQHPGVYTLQFRPSFHCNSNIFVFYKTTNGISGTRGNSFNNNYPNGPVIPGTNGFKYIDARFNGSGMNPPYNYCNKLYGTNTIPGSYALFIPRTDNGFLTTATTNAARTNKVYIAMDHMADLPYTQEHISVKLCRLLVHDNFQFGVTGYDFSDGVVSPEEQLVWNCMMAWETNTPKGQFWKVIRAITDSPLFRSQAANGSKIKTPLEFTMSAVRALRDSLDGSFTVAGGFTADTDGYTIVSGNSSTATGHPLNRMGRYLIFDREEPDGYPETGTVYVSAGALAERNRWISTILDDNQSDGISGGGRTRLNPVLLLQKYVPSSKRNNPDIVARFFLSVLFPGEGAANLDYYRRRAIDILDTAQSGTYTAGSFAATTYSTTATSEYSMRVRRAVAFLMTMPRFHEQ